MTTKHTGGPAFPVADHPSLSVDTGMTLRDYFAAKAMQALIAGCHDHDTLIIGTDSPNDNKRIAIVAFSMADAMLAEREEA